MSEFSWPHQHSVPPLAAGDVHIWGVKLQRPPAITEAMWTLLSPDERARADKFRFDDLKQQYIFGRGLMRTLIGAYLHCQPEAVDFEYGRHGKPGVAGPLHFNLSHADGVGLLAFCRECEIGVDIERVRRLTNADHVARRFFAATEYQVWSAVPDLEKPLAFFNCWTRKEAFIKAIGDGLSYPLASFAVSLRPEDPPALLQINGDEAAAARWQLESLDPLPGFVGALLVAGQGKALHCFAWPGEHDR